MIALCINHANKESPPVRYACEERGRWSTDTAGSTSLCWPRRRYRRLDWVSMQNRIGHPPLLVLRTPSAPLSVVFCRNEAPDFPEVRCVMRLALSVPLPSQELHRGLQDRAPMRSRRLYRRQDRQEPAALPARAPPVCTAAAEWPLKQR